MFWSIIIAFLVIFIIYSVKVIYFLCTLIFISLYYQYLKLSNGSIYAFDYK